jgi:hypothetical protein
LGRFLQYLNVSKHMIRKHVHKCHQFHCLLVPV